MESNALDQQLSYLKDTLGQELLVLEQIRDIELKKQMTLSSQKSIVDLTPLNTKMEEWIKKEVILEQKREAILNELSIYYGIKDLTLQNLTDYLSLHHQNDFILLRQKLILFTNDIKTINEGNKIMIQDILKLVDYTLDLIANEKTLEIDYGRKDSKYKAYGRSIVVDTVI